MRTSAVRRVVVGLALGLALAFQARYVLGQLRAAARQPADDPVAGWLAAVERLPPVPEDATVGFVTTVKPDQWEAQLFLTRYALAPRLVLYRADAPWSVCLLGSPAEADTLAWAAGMRVLGSSGSGLYLLGRQRR